MRAPLYVVRGRCIDGTVYRTALGWVDYRPAAQRMTLAEAEAAVAAQRALNATVDADSVVGQLKVLPSLRRPRRNGKHRAEVYAAGCEMYATLRAKPYDPRRVKRAERKAGMDDAVQAAYLNGEAEAMWPAAKGNPYPPGKRHDAWEQGHQQAEPAGGWNYNDPMGDWHGRNA